MAPGSIRGSILTLMSIGIGAGALTIPYALALTGFILGSLILVVCAWLTLFTLRLVVESSIATGVRNYVDLTRETLGAKAEKFVQLNQVVLLGGACVTFQIILSKLIQWFVYTLTAWEQINSYFYYVMISLATNYLIILPLSLKQNLHEFRYISIIALGSIIYVTLVLLFQLPGYLEINYSPERLVWFDWDVVHILKAFSMCSFSFGMHNHILPIYYELQDRTEKRMGKVLNRSVFIIFAIYLLIGLAGYFSTFEKTPDIVIIRERAVKTFWNALAIQVALFTLILLLLIHAPIVYFPTKHLVFKAYLDSTEVDSDLNRAFCLFFFSLSVLLAILFPNIVATISFLGGLTGSCLFFLIPTWVYAQTHAQELGPFKQKLYQGMGLVLLCMGYAAMLVTVL